MKKPDLLTGMTSQYCTCLNTGPCDPAFNRMN